MTKNSMQTFPVSRDIIEAALEELERKRGALIAQIDSITLVLGKTGGKPRQHRQEGPGAKKRGRRQMSAAARARISAAQKKRWDAYRANRQKKTRPKGR